MFTMTLITDEVSSTQRDHPSPAQTSRSPNCWSAGSPLFRLTCFRQRTTQSDL